MPESDRPTLINQFIQTGLQGKHPSAEQETREISDDSKLIGNALIKSTRV